MIDPHDRCSVSKDQVASDLHSGLAYLLSLLQLVSYLLCFLSELQQQVG